MPYAINGSALTLPPETASWKDRTLLGDDGNGHPVYAPTREFEMTWGFMDLVSFNQINNFYLACGTTGSVVASLPMFATGTYSFCDYTGCVVREPSVGAYFNTFVSNVRLTIRGIIT